MPVRSVFDRSVLAVQIRPVSIRMIRITTLRTVLPAALAVLLLVDASRSTAGPGWAGARSVLHDMQASTLTTAHALQSLGHHYGDFAAHGSLWEMCVRTQGDVTARMALVPRTLEARGLDATPPMQARLRKVGTPAALRALRWVLTMLTGRSKPGTAR